MKNNNKNVILVVVIIALLILFTTGFKPITSLFSGGENSCIPGQTKCCNSANSYCQDGTGKNLFRCEPTQSGSGIWVNRGLQTDCSSYNGTGNITYVGVPITIDPSTCQGLTFLYSKTLGSYDENNKVGEGVMTTPCYDNFYKTNTIAIVYNNFPWRTGYINTYSGDSQLTFEGQTVKCYSCASATGGKGYKIPEHPEYSGSRIPDLTTTSPSPCKWNWIDCSNKQKGSCDGYWTVSGNLPSCNCQWNCVTDHWDSKVVVGDGILGYGGLQWIASVCRTDADCPAYQKAGINYEVSCDSGLMLERKIAKLIENSNPQIGNFNRNCVTNNIVTGSAMGNLGNSLYGDASCWSDAFAKVRSETIDVSQIQGFCIANKPASNTCNPVHPTNTCGVDSCGSSYNSCQSGYTCKNNLCTSGSQAIDCIPNRPSGTCGIDSCGNVYNSCSSGEICENNVCTSQENSQTGNQNNNGGTINGGTTYSENNGEYCYYKQATNSMGCSQFQCIQLAKGASSGVCYSTLNNCLKN